jgi:membrane protease subunit (stomatin/prohibitin family)
MGLWQKITGELIDIIEWTEPTQSNILAYRFPRYNNEIKYGAKLTVREGQAAAFVNEGELADVFGPGLYTLETRNLPILSTLKGWKYGFSSPFKAEVYFISTRQWTDQKWGTSNAVMLRDPEFGPVRVRAYGTYSFQVFDPGTFLKQLVATDPSFELYEISNQLRNTIVARLVDAIGQAKIPVLDLAGNYDKLSQVALEKIAPDFAALGLTLRAFYIENVSLPPEVEKALDTRTQMGVLGDMSQYARYQAANAIGDAARNPGGVAGLGASVAAGVAVGQQMAGALGQAVPPGAAPAPPAAPAPVAPASAAAPPPLPAAVKFFIEQDGKQAGPFDLATLATRAQNGTFTRQTLVWRQGMASWVAADSVAELHSIFAEIPPPLPAR